MLDVDRERQDIPASTSASIDVVGLERQFDGPSVLTGVDLRVSGRASLSRSSARAVEATALCFA